MNGFANPVLAVVQDSPLSVERKRPPPMVPAKIVLPLTARQRTLKFVRPVFTDVHELPPSVERKIPFPPAKSVVPETAKHRTFPPSGPFVCSHSIFVGICAYPPTATPHHSHTTGRKAHTVRTTRREKGNNERINVKGRRNVFIGIGREID